MATLLPTTIYNGTSPMRELVRPSSGSTTYIGNASRLLRQPTITLVCSKSTSTVTLTSITFNPIYDSVESRYIPYIIKSDWYLKFGAYGTASQITTSDITITNTAVTLNLGTTTTSSYSAASGTVYRYGSIVIQNTRNNLIFTTRHYINNYSTFVINTTATTVTLLDSSDATLLQGSPAGTSYASSTLADTAAFSKCLININSTAYQFFPRINIDTTLGELLVPVVVNCSIFNTWTSTCYENIYTSRFYFTSIVPTAVGAYDSSGQLIVTAANRICAVQSYYQSDISYYDPSSISWRSANTVQLTTDGTSRSLNITCWSYVDDNFDHNYAQFCLTYFYLRLNAAQNTAGSQELSSITMRCSNVQQDITFVQPYLGATTANYLVVHGEDYKDYFQHGAGNTVQIPMTLRIPLPMTVEAV